MQECELHLLQTLQWRMNPPTTVQFVRHLMPLLLLGDSNEERQTASAVTDIALWQARLAVNERCLVSVPASTIAYSAVLNVLESLGLRSHTIWL